MVKVLNNDLKNINVSNQLITNAPKTRLIFDHPIKTHRRKKTRKDNQRGRKLFQKKPFFILGSFFLTDPFLLQFFSSLPLPQPHFYQIFRDYRDV